MSKETSAAFAAWSERIEPTPGPLADAARVLARGAQIRKHQVRPKPAGMVSASGAAMLLAAATKGGQGAVAEAVLFRQLVLTTGHSSRRTRRCVTPARRPRSRRCRREARRRPCTPSADPVDPGAKDAPAAAPTATATLPLDHAQRKHAASSTCSAAHRVPAVEPDPEPDRSGEACNTAVRPSATDTRDRGTDERHGARPLGRH